MQQNLFQLTGVDQLIPVHGIDGAMAYNMGPNCRAVLFDDSDDVFYIKTTDKYCVPTVKRYRFEEEILLDGDDPKAVSLKDIRSIIQEELRSVKEELLNGQQSISETDNTANTQSNTNDSSTGKHNAYKPNRTAARDKQQRSNTANVERCEKQQQSTRDDAANGE